MRKLMSLVTLLTVAALGWGGYWYVGASALERELAEWLADRRAGGWTAQAAVDTRGFPNRFDTTFESLALVDPGTGVGWTAPVFQTLQLSYNPTRVIAIWPGTQRLILPDQTVDISADRLRGSFEIAPHPDLPLTSTTVEVQSARFSSSLRGVTRLGAGQVSMRVSPEAPVANSYDLYVMATDITPPDTLTAQLGAGLALPGVIAQASADAQVVFDKPWDRSSIEVARPQPRELTLAGLSLTWGDLALTVSGTLSVNADGVPSGTLDMVATNWRGIVAVLEASGKIDPAYIGPLTTGLDLLAAMKGDPETLDIPLGFHRGILSIGPVPIGPAPSFALP